MKELDITGLAGSCDVLVEDWSSTYPFTTSYTLDNKVKAS